MYIQVLNSEFGKTFLEKKKKKKLKKKKVDVNEKKSCSIEVF